MIEHRDWGEDEAPASSSEERGGEFYSSLNRQPLSLSRNRCVELREEGV